MMTHYVSYQCDKHPNPFDCPDNLIFYSKKLGCYGIIIHDGGSSFSEIKYCPWCGKKLLQPKRTTASKPKKNVRMKIKEAMDKTTPTRY